MRCLLTALGLSTAAAFGGIEHLTGGSNSMWYSTTDQTKQPDPKYDVGFQTQKCASACANDALLRRGLDTWGSLDTRGRVPQAHSLGLSPPIPTLPRSVRLA